MTAGLFIELIASFFCLYYCVRHTGATFKIVDVDLRPLARWQRRAKLRAEATNGCPTAEFVLQTSHSTSLRELAEALATPGDPGVALCNEALGQLSFELGGVKYPTQVSLRLLIAVTLLALVLDGLTSQFGATTVANEVSIAAGVAATILSLGRQCDEVAKQYRSDVDAWVDSTTRNDVVAKS